MIHEWLDSLKINQKSLMKDMTKTAASLHELPSSVMDLLKNAIKKDDPVVLLPDQKVSFHADFSHEVTKIRRTYEVNVFPIVWDSKESVVIILNDVTMHSLTLKGGNLFYNEAKKIFDLKKTGDEIFHQIQNHNLLVFFPIFFNIEKNLKILWNPRVEVPSLRKGNFVLFWRNHLK